MEEVTAYTSQLFNIDLEADQIAALNIYEKELIKWNKLSNLTAVRDPEKIRVKHFLDSFSCSLVIEQKKISRLVDVGSGAGFPGIPLKILYPQISVSLIESTRKKARFCKHIISELCLSDIEIMQDRVELLGQDPDFRGKFDCAIARAVAVLPVLVEYLLPLVKIGGVAIAMKGQEAPLETQTAEHAINLLGGQLDVLVPVTLPGVVEERYLVEIDKIAATPERYPRRVGIPLKRPLIDG